LIKFTIITKIIPLVDVISLIEITSLIALPTLTHLIVIIISILIYKASALITIASKSLIMVFEITIKISWNLPCIPCGLLIFNKL